MSRYFRRNGPIAIAFHLARANGPRWTLLLLLERLGFQSFYNKRVQYEIARSLPGFNTVRYNQKEWSEYNWQTGGEEWSDSIEWKRALIGRLQTYFGERDKVILEIGPGGGRWSIELAKHASRLILVDLTHEALEVCRRKLLDRDNIEFHVTNGDDLSFVADCSVDLIWSFGVFVHIAPQETHKYLAEFHRVMRPGAIAIIQHPAAGGVDGGFRSSVTNELFLNMLHTAYFELLEQFSKWGSHEQHSVDFHKDMITIFKK